MPPLIPRQQQGSAGAVTVAGAPHAAAQQKQEQQQVLPQHSQLQQPQQESFEQQPHAQRQLQQQQQHAQGAAFGTSVAADNLLDSFDVFAFNAPKTPQRTTPKNAATSKRRGPGPHRSSTPLAKRTTCSPFSRTNSSRVAGNGSTSSRGDSGSSKQDNTTLGSSGSSNNNSTSSNTMSASELQRESELSPGVRLSVEWLEEAERRRGLSSAEVAAAFRCPLCHQFSMTFRSGRYGMFLGCSRYPECRGKVSGAKVEKWRCCTGSSSSSNGIRVFCELEAPHAFRLHGAGCTDTGMMLTDALPRIIQMAAKAYATKQRQHQQQEDSCSIPDFLRPLSWLPRSDRIKSDESLLRQFSDTAIAHAVSVEGVGSCVSETATTAPPPPAEAAAAGARVCELRLGETPRRLRFVDWSRGCLEAPADGLKYNDGCVFLLEAYPFVLQAAASVCGWAALTPIPSLTLRFFKEVWGPGKFLVTSKERALYAAWWLLPPRLRQHLLPFQWEGLAYALQRGGRAIIGDEMGLGKTVQAIACIAVYRQFPCLIVVPASMRLAWADALEEWLPEYSGPPNLRVLFASGDRPSPGEQHLICLSSFEMAARLYDTLKATQYKLVIVDEAHKLRGPAIPRPAPYTASEAAAAAAAAAATASTAAAEVTKLSGEISDDRATAAIQSAAAAASTAAPGSESVDFPTPQQSQQQQQHPSPRSPRKQKNWRPPDGGQEVNKKVLDLVKGSRHALLLSGTPSVKFPADLFPLVDALLPPLEQDAAAERRQQQLFQWRQLEMAAAEAAADTHAAARAAVGATAALAEDAEASEVEGKGECTAQTAVGGCVSSGIVRSPWSEATMAWRQAAATAANVTAGVQAEAFGEPLDPAVVSVPTMREKETLASFAEGGQARRRVGNILREERLQFAEEYCCSSRAFGSWRRFGASLRSWELHLLLTRAVLVRRRKTLRDPARTGPPTGDPQLPSQNASQGISQGSTEGPPGEQDELRYRQHEEGQKSVEEGYSYLHAAGQALAKASLGVPLAPSKECATRAEREASAAESENSFKAVSLSPLQGLPLSVQEVEHLVEGLPWASQASGDCDALVLPPCTRIVQLLLLHCNSKLLTAMGEGLLLRKPAFHSLLREAERATADSSESSSGDSDFGLGIVGPPSSSDIAGIAAQLTRRPPATPAERAGLCKVLSAADWLHEKFLRDTSFVSSWPEDGAEEAPPKVVVFAHHRRVLDALAARLRELRLGCMNTAGQLSEGTRRRHGFVRIDGTVPEEERRRRRRLFLKDPACTVALISITASSHGLDFSGASVCVFLELLPQQHELLQAESRLHRRGQRRVVTTYFLLSRCDPSAAAPCNGSSQEAVYASSPASCPVSRDPLSETTVAGGGQEETDNPSAEEGEELLLSASPSRPLSCPSRLSGQSFPACLSKIGTQASSREFRKELRKCCLQLLQEAEAVEEAAWHRIRYQSALVQRTIDGPLAALSQIGEQQQEAQQQQQWQPQQEESLTSVCSSSQEHEDDRPAASDSQQQHQLQQQLQQKEGPPEGLCTSGVYMCSCDSHPGDQNGIILPTAPTGRGEGEGNSETALLRSPQQLPKPTVWPPLRNLEEPLVVAVSRGVRFRISRYTQRLHAFTGAAPVPLGVSFSPAELGTASLSHSVAGAQQQQEDLHQKGWRQQLLFQLQNGCMQCPEGEVVRCVQEAAREYLSLFRLLSSFEQRRVRETAWTVENLQMYIRRRYRAQQQSSGRVDSLLGSDLHEEGSPRSAAKQEQQETAAPAVLMPRHTTDPLLLLQSAAATQQQQQQESQQLFSCIEGEEMAGGVLQPGTVPLGLSSNSSSDMRQSTNASNGRSSEADEDIPSGIVSSRYFSSQAALFPRALGPVEGFALSTASTKPPGGPISSLEDRDSRRHVVLVPVILSTPKAAGGNGRAGAAPKHLQPFSLELKKVLCVSCMQPISAVSTTRTFLRVEVFEDTQSCGAQGQLARISGMDAEDGNTRERPLVPASTHPTEPSAETQMFCAAPGGPKRRSEVMTAPQNFANDSKQQWLIRCCEQDLTCSGRCSDAYTARRRRQALRRQVERHDQGVCSNCRLDCGELLMALKMLHAAGEPQWRVEEEVVRLAPSFRKWPSLIRKLARHLTANCAWEADHRQPVKEGGGLATVDAVQTLCKACHLEKTIEERRRRKRRFIDTNPGSTTNS